MNIVQTIILGLLCAGILFILIEEFSIYMVYGNPFKNYRLYRDLIEADLPTGHKFGQIYCTRNGFISNIPLLSIFGYYYFHHDTKGNIRIPWNTPIHKMAVECMKGE